jgi:hypothetical protein
MMAPLTYKPTARSPGALAPHRDQESLRSSISATIHQNLGRNYDDLFVERARYTVEQKIHK